MNMKMAITESESHQEITNNQNAKNNNDPQMTSRDLDNHQI